MDAFIMIFERTRAVVRMNDAETVRLEEAPSHVPRPNFRDHENAFENFFAEAPNFSRFREKTRGDALGLSDLRRFEFDRTDLMMTSPKLGGLRHRDNVELIRVHARRAGHDGLRSGSAGFPRL
jgi:hypothetical protein